ncbi:MAG: hypothetical protein KC620_18670 [Myxococcales bacterium]|nr:hypothetical protein [Myxococcales bacterium]
MNPVEHYRALVEEQVRGRRCILAMGVVAGMTHQVEMLRALGAGPFLLLGETIGAGALPDPAVAEWHVVSEPGQSIMDSMRKYVIGLRNLSPEVAAAVEAFDPDHKALLLPGFVVDIDAVAGRQNRFGRRPSWIAYEDKVQVEGFWDRQGVPRAPSQVVPAAAEALSAAAAALDAGQGTVWAGDAREGFNGGAEYVRWVQTKAHAEAAIAFYEAHCDQVRVVPFLDGIPCSIHGIVFDDTVITFRPCEMVVLRRPGQARFLYAGAASYWDPPAADREAMRALARKTGAGLRAEVGFRGPFTIDGIMTKDGFRPTEINARLGAALAMLTKSLPDLPLELLSLFIKAGLPLDYRPELLERLLLEAADSHRAGGAWSLDPAPRSENFDVQLAWRDGAFVEAAEGEPADGKLMVGPSFKGTFVRFWAEPARTPVGPSIGPRAIAAFAYADRHFGTAYGKLEAAPDLRRG